MPNDKFLGAVIVNTCPKHDTYMHLYNIRDSWNHLHYGKGETFHYELRGTVMVPRLVLRISMATWHDGWETGGITEEHWGWWWFSGNFRKSQHSITFPREKALRSFRCTRTQELGHLQHDALQYSRRSGAWNESGSWLSAGRWPLGRWIQSKLSSDWLRQSTKPSW